MVTTTTTIRIITEAVSRNSVEAKSGYSLALPPTVSPQNVHNYKSLASVSNKAHIVKSVQQKTDNSNTDENSIMSIVSF